MTKKKKIAKMIMNGKNCYSMLGAAALPAACAQATDENMVASSRDGL
jgi:hypothetical protein